MTKRVQDMLIALFIFAAPMIPATIMADANDDQSEEPMPSRPQQEVEDKAQPMPVQAPEKPFTSFTGKIAKNKVRMRLQPNLEAPILKELNQGDLLIAIGESEDYYAVQPPEGIKAYVFRTYILDNVVEANKVNVRLEPNLDAPVVAQLSAGDKVDGIISALNSKWLEITPPKSTRFYVAKDFVEKIGDANMMATINKKRSDVNQLLNSTYMSSQEEMQKEYPDIRLDGIYANLNKVINQYPEFTEQTNRAKELTKMLQENHLQKKIDYLEKKDKNAQDNLANKTSEMTGQVKAQQDQLTQLQQQLNRERTTRKGSNLTPASTGVNVKMAAWAPVEQNLYSVWSEQNGHRPIEEFYREQGAQAVVLRGVVEPYTRVIKNKPGDYVLVNQSNHLPIAYMYSTLVNLQDKVGQEVTIYGAPRPNNNFAFPSYFVLTAE